jgi:hypothetical protein
VAPQELGCMQALAARHLDLFEDDSVLSSRNHDPIISRGNNRSSGSACIFADLGAMELENHRRIPQGNRCVCAWPRRHRPNAPFDFHGGFVPIDLAVCPAEF